MNSLIGGGKRRGFVLSVTMMGLLASLLIAAGPASKEPVVTVEHVEVLEGDAGVTVATFTVSLSKPPRQEVTVDYATADGTATAGVDYVPVSGTLVFPRRVRAATIDVEIKADTDFESNEVFFLNLSNPVNATIGMGTAEGRIVNDDVQPRTLTVVVDGAGSVMSSPGGIDCPGDCSEDFGDGEMVTLTATADSGWEFSSWSGACTGGDPTCTVTMDADKSATATFDPEADTHVLAVTIDSEASGGLHAGGQVTSDPTGIDCHTVYPDTASQPDCEEDYDAGTLVTLTAEPFDHQICGGDPGTCSPVAGEPSFFAGWGGACASFGTDPACMITMDQAHDVTASFVLDDPGGGTGEETKTLFVQAAGSFESLPPSEYSGSVTSSPPGINCQGHPEGFSSGSCDAEFQTGSSVTLTADDGSCTLFGSQTPCFGGDGQHFQGWGGACASAGTNPECTIVMNDDTVVTASWGP